MLRLVPVDASAIASARAEGVAASADTARSTWPDLSFDVSMGDWDELLNAVKARLTLIGGEWLLKTPEPFLFETITRSRVSVLECVQALNQLHATLGHELDRRHLLERELGEMRAALARARAELNANPPSSGPCQCGPVALERPYGDAPVPEPSNPLRSV